MITKHQSQALSQACCLLLVFLLLPVTRGWAEEPALNAQREQLRTQLRKLSEDFERSRAAQTREHRQLHRLQTRLDQTRRDARELAGEQAAEQKQLRRLQAELTQIEANRATQLARLQQISMLHSRARARTEAETDAATRTRHAGWLRLVGQQRATLLEQLAQARQRQAVLLAEREQRLAQLAEREAQLRREQNKLQALDRERREILRALDEKLRSSRERQQNLSGRLQELDSLLDQLSRVGQRNGGLKAQRGRLAWPLQGPVLRDFGQRRDGQMPSRGILVAARAGTAVPAVHGGTVAWVGWLPQKGLSVVVDHGQDYYSLYAHAESVLYSIGDPVPAGRTLLHVGQTGGLDQPALYFELLQGRQALNPRRWFKDAPR